MKNGKLAEKGPKTLLPRAEKRGNQQEKPEEGKEKRRRRSPKKEEKKKETEGADVNSASGCAKGATAYFFVNVCFRHIIRVKWELLCKMHNFED